MACRTHWWTDAVRIETTGISKSIQTIRWMVHILIILFSRSLLWRSSIERNSSLLLFSALLFLFKKNHLVLSWNDIKEMKEIV